MYEPTWTRFGSVAAGVFVAYLFFYFRGGVKRVFSNGIMANLLVPWGLLMIAGLLLSPPMDKDNMPSSGALLFGLSAGSAIFSGGIGIVMLSCLCCDADSARIVKLVNWILSLKVRSLDATTHFQLWAILSNWSYANYLVHIIVINQIYSWTAFQAKTAVSVPQFLGFFLLVNVLVWPLSFLLHKFVEKPAASWNARKLKEA